MIKFRLKRSIGIYAPRSFSDPENVSDDLKEYDSFTRPGERRQWRKFAE